MSSSSSGTSTQGIWRYDVFLSFRGKDTRKGFTSHLYSALKDAGINAFKDDDALPRGEKISSELEQAIEESRIAIIVFSTNYANSRWCLEELEKIMEAREMHGQLVLPVFYDVDPSEVRKQIGSFAQAFAEHEACSEEERDRAIRWKTALTKAGNLSGWDLKNVVDGHEAILIEDIVNNVLQELPDAYLDVPTFGVGLETRLEKIKSLLYLGSDEVLFIGICGREGIGKTTIAEAVYNRFFHAFEGRSFLANVSGDFWQLKDLISLQKQLLSDIVKHRNIKIRNIRMGISAIKRALCNRRVLIVLDDVRDSVQIKALVRERHWFGSGSRIIITTRDQGLLQDLDGAGIYMVEQLDDNDAFQLFSWHAFSDSHPKEEFIELSKEIASHCKGEPLALEVLGSFLKNRSLVEWRSAFVHLKRTGFDWLCDDKEKDESPCIAKSPLQKKLMYRKSLQALGNKIFREEYSKIREVDVSM
ncbi:disease resistance protein RUN1 [Eucalyptus grandis]|uniref:disease resistance protein RUN1 n=1 Tax=Eucalyptus grandis TaxID=71139 RepID=UPI00192ED0A1|nr:disease resistance protein RUN1 [Eucalyptus grandis]